MRSKPYIVGITGGSASGKTSFLHELAAAFSPESITVVSQDHYYHPREMQLKDDNGETNFDLPTSIDRQLFYDDIHALIQGVEVKKKEYTFNNPNKEPGIITLKPAPIMVLEGLFVFHYDEICDLCDLRLFIETDEEIAFKRRLHRDYHERGYSPESVTYQWKEHVMPSYKKYLLPLRSKADIIVVNNIHYKNGLEVVLNHLHAKVLV